MKIAWNYTKPLKSNENIIKVESFLDITFPEDFVEVVKNFNAASPEPHVFDTESAKGRVFGGLLDFNIDQKSNVLRDYKTLKDRLPENVIPFAEDPGGNFICFDYRNHEVDPEIILWLHEGIVKDGVEHYELERVAASFDSFMRKLYKSDISFNDSDFDDVEILPI